ncbi:restriction endonuclease subunit S [Pauljensenia sp. UMB6358]|uniref:restriction endonuclease subunit S n=1 Tax=unclassified Pauljensenia TaxID=2908895 RepID=UPI00254EE2A4|nr:MULTISPECIES: restriction endonuclease subunit S [unclassified Pauljensenia]MDK7122264.1 restriction endonuclease subunit S [Pauljensenia sp. UMB6358]MDK7229859.1 restriction endonuclease subunit S [Pauljensenia sp. UMB1177]
MWKATTLGEVAEIITGPFGSALHKSDYKPSGTAVLMPQNIGNRTVDYQDIARIGEEDTERLSRYRVTQDDIIYARRGDVEKHAFVTANDTDMICGTGCMRIRVSSPEVMPKFASFYLNRPETRQWVVQHAVGSNMPNLNSGIVSAIPLSYPPKDEQEAIVDLLDSLDVAIATNVQVNDNLQAMALSQFMHQFFRKDPNGELSDVLIELPKSQVQVRDAKDIAGRYPFFTSGASVLRWDEPLAGGRNLLLNTGGNADVKFYVGEMAYSTDTWAITARDDLADYAYLLLQAISPELDQKYFLGTGLRHLQKPLLKKRPIYIPSDAELNVFNAVAVPAMTMISENLRENRQLQELRDWLLPMLMNGQATVASSDKLSFT